jgi:hypothetical protein
MQWLLHKLKGVANQPLAQDPLNHTKRLEMASSLATEALEGLIKQGMV